MPNELITKSSQTSDCAPRSLAFSLMRRAAHHKEREEKKKRSKIKSNYRTSSETGIVINFCIWWKHPEIIPVEKYTQIIR